MKFLHTTIPKCWKMERRRTLRSRSKIRSVPRGTAEAKVQRRLGPLTFQPSSGFGRFAFRAYDDSKRQPIAMTLSTPLGFTVTVKYRAKRSYRFPNDLANRVARRWGRGHQAAAVAMRIRQNIHSLPRLPAAGI
mgnify:CR=1 FL=1